MISTNFELGLENQLEPIVKLGCSQVMYTINFNCGNMVGPGKIAIATSKLLCPVVNMALSCSKFHKFVDLVQNWFVGLEFSFYL